MTKSIRNKELLLAAVGIFLFAATIGFLFYSVNFIIGEVRMVVEENIVTSQSITKFNLEDLKKIGIIKQPANTPSSTNATGTGM